MDSTFGDFQMEETNGNHYLVHHLDDNSGEQKTSSGVSTTFFCPLLRLKLFLQRFQNLCGEEEQRKMNHFEMDSSPYFNSESLDDEYKRKRLDLEILHYVLPLFWCKNKDHDVDGDDDDDDPYNLCKFCEQHLNIGTDYYFCAKCDRIYHKECVESPLEIKHPYHPYHPLKFMIFMDGVDCGHCQTKEECYVYHCSLCNVSMDIVCALKPIPFVVEKTKRHDHFLTFFTRKDPLRCNVCGLINKTHPTYACFECNYVVHKDCVDFPSVIRISRHHHRIYFTSSLEPGKWSCGVCHKNVDSEYGTYTCKKCDDYVVHPRCALRKDIWDGKELERVPEEDDIEEILEPFQTISDGLILHFLHNHFLKVETIGDVYDERKNCHACALPIYEGKFYSCMECDFILHDECVNAPRKKRHPLHPHPFTLKLTTGYNYNNYFQCDVCFRQFSGFVYERNIGENYFKIDVRCGSISEPFVYQGHEHPLFLALDPQETHFCQICQEDNIILINCIECDFIICLRCVNLPYMVKYKHDKHFLTLIHGKETDDPNGCEICEKLLISSNEEEVVKKDKEDDFDEYGRTVYKRDKGEDINDKRFYECKQCCTTLHINCLLGNIPYMRPGHTLNSFNYSVETAANTSLSRPFCHRCNDRCFDKIYYKVSYEGQNYTMCCFNHAL